MIFQTGSSISIARLGLRVTDSVFGVGGDIENLVDGMYISVDNWREVF